MRFLLTENDVLRKQFSKILCNVFLSFRDSTKKISLFLNFIKKAWKIYNERLENIEGLIVIVTIKIFDSCVCVSSFVGRIPGILSIFHSRRM